MADTDYASLIRTEQSAYVMREEIANGIEQAQNDADNAVNTAENANNTVNIVNERVDEIIAHGADGSLEELVDIRNRGDGTVATTAGDRVRELGSDLAEKANQTDVNNSLLNKVDKVTGKGLSTNDYDNTEKAQVATNKSDITAIKSQVASLASGSPKAVSLVANMTDTTKNYVYTGSESGYTSGNWYYYNGSAWVSGGIYQSTGIADDSVTPENTTFLTATGNLFDINNAHVGYYYATSGSKDTALTANADYTAFLLPVSGGDTYTVSGTNFMRTEYATDGSKIGSFGDYSTDANVTFTTQNNARYVGISWNQSSFPNGTYAIFKGSSIPLFPKKIGYEISNKIFVEQRHHLLTVKKDGTGDFLRVCDAVKYAENFANQNDIYDIYIYDTSTDYKGTSFDILAEMGGDTYLSTITDTSNNQKGMPLTGYVNLYGIGKVKLYAHLANTVTLAQSTCFSVIDAFDNFYCENLTFEIQNGRYPFHDESNNTHPYENHKFNKCKFVHLGNATGLWSAPHAYAAGTSAGCIYEYKDCVFDASASGGYSWDLHNYAPQLGSIISLDSCQMIKASSQATSIKLGFNGYSPVTDNPSAYDVCYNDVFIKNIIADGKITVAPETSNYSCTNNYRLHNFTSLINDIQADFIKS